MDRLTWSLLDVIGRQYGKDLLFQEETLFRNWVGMKETCALRWNVETSQWQKPDTWSCGILLARVTVQNSSPILRHAAQHFAFVEFLYFAIRREFGLPRRIHRTERWICDALVDEMFRLVFECIVLKCFMYACHVENSDGRILRVDSARNCNLGLCPL